MKLQYMIIIFAIIIIPITLLLTIYIQSQTDSIALQTKYNTMLLDATYDAVVALQSNTLNNENSSNKDSLRESIVASINTFTNSLSNNLGVGGYSKEYLMPYVPAIAYTMYDGFYIYSPINNLQTEVKTETSPTGDITTTKTVNELNYEHVLKPYIYYSESTDNGYIINYSLDNYITIYGNGIGKEGAKSGYLIDPNEVIINGSQVTYNSINGVNGVKIESEKLTENISIIDKETNEPKIIKDCQYFYNIDHEKIYKDENGLFKVKDYTRQDRISVFQKIVNESGEIEIKEIKASDDFPEDQSAKVYYVEAKKFSETINGNLSLPDYLKIGSDNNPNVESSYFVQHKREVIKACIEDNLNNAINSYNSQSGKEYNFKMPKITEEDWEQIYRNISVISFLQGIPAGLRAYNNYAVVTSTGNKQYVDPDAIYLIGSDLSYHNKDCIKLEGSDLTGYQKYDFNQYRKNYNSSDYYYKHNKTATEYLPACYYCIVDSTIAEGSNPNASTLADRNKCYYTALARERYNLIKTTQNFN